MITEKLGRDGILSGVNPVHMTEASTEERHETLPENLNYLLNLYPDSFDHFL